MRLGIISDVHSNFEALQATHRELVKRGCKKIICLGDVVGYGPSPNECIDFFIEHEIESIKGNHDYYMNCPASGIEELGITENAYHAVNWTRSILKDSNRKWLDRLPFTLTRHEIMFIHAAVDTAEGEYWPYIFDIQSAMFHFYLQNTEFAFFGHVHVPLLFACHSHDKSICPTILVEKPKDRNFDELSDQKFLINPGSVGQPRNRDPRSSSLLLDLETREMQVVTVQYNIRETCKKILKAGLPDELALRLVSGI